MPALGSPPRSLEEARTAIVTGEEDPARAIRKAAEHIQALLRSGHLRAASLTLMAATTQYGEDEALRQLRQRIAESKALTAALLAAASQLVQAGDLAGAERKLEELALVDRDSQRAARLAQQIQRGRDEAAAPPPPHGPPHPGAAAGDERTLAMTEVAAAAAPATAAAGLATARRRPWLAVGAAAALLLIVALLLVKLRPAASPATPAAAAALTAAAPSGRAAPPPPRLGLVRVDALPWARVVRITGPGGQALSPGGSDVTPLVLELPAGRYSILLRGPADQSRTLAVDVDAAGAATPALVDFAKVDADAYLRAAGL